MRHLTVVLSAGVSARQHIYGEAMPGNGASVWIIDADHWPRAYLRAELIERGYEAIGFVAAADALLRLALDRERPALILIELQGQSFNPRQLEALLRERFPVVAIGGAAEWATESLRARPWAAFLRRPLTVGNIADEVERILGARAAATSGP